MRTLEMSNFQQVFCSALEFGVFECSSLVCVLSCHFGNVLCAAVEFVKEIGSQVEVISFCQAQGVEL